MKKLFFCAAVSMMSMTALASTSVNDTVDVKKPLRVIVVTNDSLQKVEIFSKDGVEGYHYDNAIQLVDSNYESTTTTRGNLWDFNIFNTHGDKHKKFNNEIVMNFYAGWCNTSGMPSQVDVRTFSSWELWWVISDWNFHPWWNNHAFSVGIGLDWRNFRMTDDYRFVQTTDNHTVIDKYPGDAHPKFSRIKVFSINFPIRYHYRVKHFGFSLGPVINLNTYSSIKTRYTMGGEEVKDVNKNVKVNPITVDFMGTLSLRDVNMYFKYSPCNMLNSDYCPKFKTLSFGFFL